MVKSKKGFTLAELLIVVAIIAVKDKGTVLCPNLHNINRLPSTREGKVVD